MYSDGVPRLQSSRFCFLCRRPPAVKVAVRHFMSREKCPPPIHVNICTMVWHIRKYDITVLLDECENWPQDM